jgi:hypothetical protein
MEIDEFKEYIEEKKYWFEEIDIQDFNFDNDEVYDYIINYNPLEAIIDYRMSYNKSYIELLNYNYENCQFQGMSETGYTYNELLKSYEWSMRRLEIILLYGIKCSNCGNKKNLEVHHKVYVENLVPWNYHFRDLITLCRNCHQITHDIEIIPEITLLEYKSGLLGGNENWRKENSNNSILMNYSFENLNNNFPPVSKREEKEEPFLNGCFVNIFYVFIMIIIVKIITSFF